MKHSIVYRLIAIFITLAATSCGPGNVKDLKNVEVTPIRHDDGTDRYRLIKDKVTELVGLADLNGDIIVPPQYLTFGLYFNKISPEKDVITLLNQDNKWGARLASGKEIIDEKYDGIEYEYHSDSAEGFRVWKREQRNNKYDIKDGQGRTHTVVDDTEDTLYGFITLDGKELVPVKYGILTYAGDDYFKVSTTPSKELKRYYGLYKDGKQIIDCDYADLNLSGSKNGAYACKQSKDGERKGEKHLLINIADGCSEKKIHKRARTSDNYAIIRDIVNGLFSDEVLDFDGNIIIPGGRYSDIGEKDGYFLCTEFGGATTTLLTGPNAETQLFSQDGITLSYKGKFFRTYNRRKMRYGAIDRNGNEILPCEYDRVVADGDSVKAYVGRDVVYRPIPD